VIGGDRYATVKALLWIVKRPTALGLGLTARRPQATVPAG